jgi:hypothetical protein
VSPCCGVAVGKVEKFGKLPVNFNIGAYYNAVRPSGLGPDWQTARPSYLPAAKLLAIRRFVQATLVP